MGLPQHPLGPDEIAGNPGLDRLLQADVDVFRHFAERHPAIGYLEFDRTHESPPGQLGRYPLIPQFFYGHEALFNDSKTLIS
jgi:hypothetical protein